MKNNETKHPTLVAYIQQKSWEWS